MPIIGSEGAASSGGFGQFALSAAVPNYIEDVFSTYIYTGNGGTLTINNGIDLSGKGGLVWSKSRDSAADNNLFDTARGKDYRLITNNTNAQQFTPNLLTAFNSDGFSLSATGGSAVNANNKTFASWTFRKQPKFFNVVTYTGNGVNNRDIPYQLSSEVKFGAVIIKRTNGASYWPVMIGHTWGTAQNPTSTTLLNLNTTSFSGVNGFITTGAAGTFRLVAGATDNTAVNAVGGTYVAYIFAHDTSADGLIKCGRYAGNSSTDGPQITLDWEPQWLLIKQNTSASTTNWQIIDNMRGMPNGSADATLQPNLRDAESSADYVSPLATGFKLVSADSQVNGSGFYNYIAIRRGPMKVPTSGSTVLFPTTNSAIGASDWSAAPLSEKSVDCLIGSTRTNSPNSGFIFTDRLRGLNGSYATSTSANLNSSSTSAESTSSYPLQLGDTGGTIGTNRDSPNSITYLLKRAPGFFDVVCYTGTGSGGLAVNHNLSVTPEWVIIKRRDAASSFGWFVIRFPAGGNDLLLNSDGTGGFNALSAWSSTTFTLASGFGDVNASGGTYVAYLFASAPGVSKVGSFTGTGATQVINCGFTGGARFVLIKATSTTGNWLVWDSARGIVAGNDPYLALNSTAAEVTNTDWVDTAATGFELSNAGGNLANSSGVTYIFLAIA